LARCLFTSKAWYLLQGW